MLREKRIVSQTILLTEKMADTVQQAIHTLRRSFAEVVWACVASDLQKFTAQKRKQKRAQEMGRDCA